MQIAQPTQDDTVNLALDTISRGKQAIIFANTKSSAEKTAEEIAKKAKGLSLSPLAEQALHALSSPTKQCRRLSACLKKGIAFHHSGLAPRQRELVEERFRDGTIKIIAATPTLAAGLDLPAYRVLLKDLRRYGPRGLQYIPVLEYLQMAGRAGRPSFDTKGEAILLASSEHQKEELVERYLRGSPEALTSKLAAEPALRASVLSLIATGIAGSRTALLEFFSQTFWAHQYGDEQKLHSIVDRVTGQLAGWGFIRKPESGDFVSADELASGKLAPTPLGKRVAELYVDPYTAAYLLEILEKSSGRHPPPFSWLHALCMTLEMRPPLRAGVRDQERVQEALVSHGDDLLHKEPSLYDEEYQDFLNGVKTALFLHGWIEEKTEESLLEDFSIRPGETRVKLSNTDWLLYCLEELARLQGRKEALPLLRKLRVRVKHGVKEELLPLLKFRGVGRMRARKLFNASVRDVKGVKDADLSTLSHLVGRSTAASLKKQVGQDVAVVKENKRKGQISLKDFG